MSAAKKENFWFGKKVLVTGHTGSKIKLNFGAIPYRENEVMNSVADLSDIKKLGWTPRISLSKAIDMTLKDWKF